MGERGQRQVRAARRNRRDGREPPGEDAGLHPVQGDRRAARRPARRRLRPSGLALSGDTAVARRKTLVKTFQEDEHAPFFVLSLKAGGSGLNLTAASHVVHFDRWWNPAVENQATDRAFRIGQKRNVLVHKFVCRGTIEERIDQLIESKRQMADDMLAGGGEINLTELDRRRPDGARQARPRRRDQGGVTP